MPRTPRTDAATAQVPRRRVVTLGAAALVASACGARTSLTGETAGEAGASSESATTSTSSLSTTSPSTSIGGGGAGDGGSHGGGGGQGGAAACETLVWAGEPVLIAPAVAPRATFPTLIALDEGSVAVVFEEVGGGSTLVSATIEPWSAWPPPLGLLDWHFPISLGGSPIAVSEGDAADFTFATTDGFGAVVIGRAVPGGASAVELPGATGSARFIARAAGTGPSPLLIGHGSPNGLVASWIASLEAFSAPTILGGFGCADRPLAVEASRFGEGFVVASTADAPLDDCADPDIPGPPLAAQVHVFDRGGALLGADAFEREAPIVDIRVAERAGGGWLATIAEGDASAVIQPIALDGTIDAYALHFGLHEGGDFELRGWSGAQVPSGLAVVQTGPIPESATGVVVVQLFDGAFDYVAHTVSSPLTPLAPTGRPTLLVSPDGRSFLVAFEHAPREPGASGSTIALMRADCAPL